MRWLAPVLVCSILACFSPPAVDTAATFACNTAADCVAGYVCVDGFCAAAGDYRDPGGDAASGDTARGDAFNGDRRRGDVFDGDVAMGDRNRGDVAVGDDNCSGCFIGGQCYADLAPNPQNPCEVCDASASPAAWQSDDTALCSLPNTEVAYCSGGACLIETCTVGFDDCDGSSPGCETATDTDVGNCGACTNSCAIPGMNAAGVACDYGRCIATMCSAGFADRDRDETTGCEAAVYLVDELSTAMTPDGTPGNEFPTIGEALTMATPPAVISVAPGTYDEQVVIANANVSIEGWGMGATVIEGPVNDATGITVQASGASVRDLSITMVRTGIVVAGTSGAQLLDVFISDVEVSTVVPASGSGGRGLRVNWAPDAVIQNCSVTGVRSVAPPSMGGGGGGGMGPAAGIAAPSSVAVHVQDSVGAVVRGCQVDDVVGAKGGGKTNTYGRPGRGGLATGILIQRSDNCVARNNTVSNVTGGAGGNGLLIGARGGAGAGVYLEDASGCVVAANAISNIDGGVGGVHPSVSTRDGGDQAGFGVFLVNPSAIDNTVATDNSLDGDSIIYLNGASNVHLGGRHQTSSANPTNHGIMAVRNSNDIRILSSNVVGRPPGGQWRVGDAGGPGYPGYGIHIDGCTDCEIRGNTLTAIVGGTPEPGTTGGDGGEAIAIRVTNAMNTDLYENTISGVTGGDGGGGFHCWMVPACTWGAAQGGFGGRAVGVEVTGSNDVGVFDLDVQTVTGGVGGRANNPRRGGVALGLSIDSTTTSGLRGAHIAIVSGGVGGRGAGDDDGANGGGADGVVLNGVSNGEISDAAVEFVTGGAGGPVAGLGTPGAPGRGRGVTVIGTTGVVLLNFSVAQVFPGAGVPEPVQAAVVIDTTLVTAFEHVTITDVGSTAGRGLWVLSGQSTPFTLRNSIIWDISDICVLNDAGVTVDAEWSDIGACMAADTAGMVTLTDVQSMDPEFFNPPGDLHLMGTSPCIDAGRPASSCAAEPSMNGCRVNMGRYGNTVEATASANAVTDCQMTCP